AELARRGIPAAVHPFEWWVSPRRTLLGATTRLLRNVRRLRPLAAQVARWGCDVVYSNSSVFAIGAMAAARLGLPHVWHLREFGGRDYGLWPALGSRLAPLGVRPPDATIFVSHALRRGRPGRGAPGPPRRPLHPRA